MSLFGKVFGTAKPAPESSSAGKSRAIQNAMEQLRNTEELLTKKQEHLEKKMHEELVHAKALGKTNKTRAKQHLQRRRRYEQQSNSITGQINTVQAQMDALESTSTNNQVLGAMHSGAQAMKNASQDADKVHDLLDDINEQMELHNEVTQALSASTLGPQIDDDELEDELNDLMEEDLADKYTSVAEGEGAAEPIAFPDVPSTSAVPIARPAKAAAKDDDFGELEAWAS